MDKEDRNARNRATYAANREAVLASQAAFYRANPERRAAKQKAWRDSHPECAKKHWDRSKGARRAMRLDLFDEDVDRRVVWDRDSGICHICKEPADPALWHLDHVVPLKLGGRHSYANTAVSHPRCNLSKGSRPPVR